MMSVMLGLLLGLASPVAPDRVPSDKHTLRVPDEINDAMQPYVDCRLQSLGAKMVDKDGKARPKLTRKGGDCATYKAKASTDSDAALKALGKTDDERAKTIADTLKMIDDFVDEMRRAMRAAGEGV